MLASLSSSSGKRVMGASFWRVARPGSSMGQTSMEMGSCLAHSRKTDASPPAKWKQNSRKLALGRGSGQVTHRR